MHVCVCMHMRTLNLLYLCELQLPFIFVFFFLTDSPTKLISLLIIRAVKLEPNSVFTSVSTWLRRLMHRSDARHTLNFTPRSIPCLRFREKSNSPPIDEQSCLFCMWVSFLLLLFLEAIIMMIDGTVRLDQNVVTKIQEKYKGKKMDESLTKHEYIS